MKKKLQIRNNKEAERLSKEAYYAIIDYQKPDGLWEINREEIVYVKCEENENPKNLRDKAIKMVMEKFPKCQINKCSYC